MDQSAEEKQAAIAWLLKNAPAAVQVYVNSLLQELSTFEASSSGIKAWAALTPINDSHRRCKGVRRIGTPHDR